MINWRLNLVSWRTRLMTSMSIYLMEIVKDLKLSQRAANNPKADIIL